MKSNLTLLFVVLSVCVTNSPAQPAGEVKATGLTVAWTKRLAKEPLKQYVGTAVVTITPSVNGTALIVGTLAAIPRQEETDAPWLEVMRVKPDGNLQILATYQATSPPGFWAQYGKVPEICDAEASIDGNLWIVAEGREYRPELIALNRDGGVLFRKDVEFHMLGTRASSEYGQAESFTRQPPEMIGTIKIESVVAMPENTCMLLGFQDGPEGPERALNSRNGLAMLVDAGGELLWTKSYDKGHEEYLTSGIPLPRGGHLLLAANSGSYQWLDMGTGSHVWLLKCDGHGRVISERVFEGRNAQLVVMGAGRYGLVYDREHTRSRDIWVVQVSEDLTPVWQNPVRKWSDEVGFEVFRASGTSEGHLVIAGTVPVDADSGKYELIVHQYDPAGEKVGNLSLLCSFPMQRSVQLAVSANMAYILWRALVKADDADTAVEVVELIAVNLVSTAKGSE